MFPPPLLFLPAIFGGMFLDVRWPLRLPPSRAMDIAAGILIVGFLILVVPSILRFQRSSTSILPFRPASRLVTSGAYRFTRNPMYLSMVAMLAGLSLTFSLEWGLLLTPVLWLVYDRLIVAREELYLTAKFGADYQALLQQTAPGEPREYEQARPAARQPAFVTGIARSINGHRRSPLPRASRCLGESSRYDPRP